MEGAEGRRKHLGICQGCIRINSSGREMGGACRQWRSGRGGLGFPGEGSEVIKPLGGVG